MRAFFAASSERDAEKAAARIVATGAAFEDVRARLERGRTYEPSVGRGDVLWQAYGPGGLHFLSRRTWLRTFAAAGLAVVGETSLTPWVRRFELRQHASRT